MATFSVNQNRQLFVQDSDYPVSVRYIFSSDDPNGERGSSSIKSIYFNYEGVAGPMRSDIIDLDKIISSSYTRSKWVYPNAKVITLSSEVNGGAPIPGQDYILRLFFKQYIGNSDIYQAAKYGAVHAYKDMTASDFYLKMAQSLVLNMLSEAVPLVDIYLINGDVDTSTGSNNPLVQFSDWELKNTSWNVSLNTIKNSWNFNGNYTGIVIIEHWQPWVRGIKKMERVYFDLIPTTVTYNGDEVTWGEASSYELDFSLHRRNVKFLQNGHEMADLEYFCKGERGDQYRFMGWPHNLETKYLVNPEESYDVIDIHYYSTGSGVSNQKSEKTITILGGDTAGNNGGWNGLCESLQNLNIIYDGGGDSITM